MTLKRHRTVSDKRTCDRCHRPAPPIYEVTVIHASRPHWVDLCETCVGAIESAGEPEGLTEFRERVLFPGIAPMRWRSYRGRSDSNVYGPRPEGGGFRCALCGTEAGPLFGVDEHQKAATNRSWCARCLPRADVSGGNIVPTPDAAAALRMAGSRNGDVAGAYLAPAMDMGKGAPKRTPRNRWNQRRGA